MSMLPGSPRDEPGTRAASPEALLEALDPEQREVAEALPGLRLLGGCCGTDARHVRAISEACLAAR